MMTPVRTLGIAALGGLAGATIGILTLACCIAAARADRNTPQPTEGPDILDGTTPNHIDDGELEHLAGRRNKGRHP